MKEWLIVGGGIHGTYLANLLTHQPDLAPENVGILDPHDDLLAAWNRMTTNCGMHYLRSPATHHVDLPILSIYQFAKTPAGQPLADFIPPYNRPSLPLFREHANQVIARSGLAQRHIKGRALAVLKDGPGFMVETTCGPLRTRRILLAIGMSEQLCWPSWAQRLRQAGATVSHVFEPSFQRNESTGGPTLVVGGGITAVQTALAMADRPGADITLLARRPLQESQFDFNPCWIGPKCLRQFYQEDYDERRATIDGARVPGSLPGEVLTTFERARSASRLEYREGAIRDAALKNGTIELQMDDGAAIHAQRIVLATGFQQERPGGHFVDRLIEDFQLPCNPCGYPIVGDDLQWGENIYATGPLAELQIGPCARNIVGARNAGRMLLASLPGA